MGIGSAVIGSLGAETGGGWELSASGVKLTA